MACLTDVFFFDSIPKSILLLTAFFVLLLTAYAFFFVKYRFWSSRNISGPAPTIPFGNFLKPKGVSWQDMNMQDIAKYGKVFGVYQGVSPVLVVADPDLLKEIFVREFNSFSETTNTFHKIQKQSLFFTNGQRWKDMRSIMSPTFTSGKMKAMHHLMKSAVSMLLEHMDSQMVNGSLDFNNKELYGDLTLGVIARCAFATDTNAHQTRGDNVFVKQMKAVFEFSNLKILTWSIVPEFVQKWAEFTISPLGPLNFLVDMSRSILQQRKQMGKNKNVDMLQLMLDAETTSADGQVQRLTDEEIIANTLLILVAGYETTSSLLTFCTYCLAMNPEIQDRLRQEIEEAVAADAGEIKYDTIMNLKYLDAVINETLRLYIPSVNVQRNVTNDYEFKSLGLKVKKGSKIMIPLYAIHHQEEFFPDPFKFDPERFMPENKDNLIPYTFLPFLLGPRNCIGARFALLEAKTALASVLIKYNINRCDQTAVPLDMSESSFILISAKEVIVNYSQRK